MPAREYCFNLNKIWDLSKSETKVPFFGLILIDTDPYSGGVKSSPPITETDSALG